MNNTQDCEDLCKDCAGDIILNPSNKRDFLYTNNLTCPHCGFIIKDSWEFQICDGELKCGGCNKNFKYTRIMDYRTEKL